MKQFVAVVFDLDDTLYLERDYVRSGFAAVSTWLSQQPGWCEATAKEFRSQCWRLFLRGQRGKIFDRAFASLGYAPEPATLHAMIDCYRDHSPCIQLADDVLPLLGRLAVEGVALGVITDGHRCSQWAKLRALGLPDVVTEIVVTDDWGRPFWKPHPRAFQHMEQCLGVKGPDCVYVGDNPTKDFLAPRQRGWATVRIQRPGGLHCHVPAPLRSRADAQYRSLRAWEVACWRTRSSSSISACLDGLESRVK